MALVGNAGIEIPGIFVQCTNDACGALLRMGNDYKHGQVVGCPECGSPFTLAPESPSAFLGGDFDGATRGMSPLAMLRSGNTPESARLHSIKKDTLFQFPSPSASELGAMLDIPDTDMLVSSFGHCQQMRNLTPSLEATVAYNDSDKMLTAPIFPEDISDLARIGGLGSSPLRPAKSDRSKGAKGAGGGGSGGGSGGGGAGGRGVGTDALRGVGSAIDAAVQPPTASVEAYLAANAPMDAMHAASTVLPAESAAAVASATPSKAASGGAASRSAAGSRTAGGGTSTSQLSCRYCGKVFKKAGRLLTHERKHTGERPFSCTECTKSFRDAAALEGHISRQHREQPFHCPTCSKGFSSKRQLMIHGRVHTGEKPFHCVVCNRKFSQEGNLHTHIRRHMINFGLDPVTDALGAEVPNKKHCRLCGFQVTDETALKSHVKYHIKAGDLPKLQEHMNGSAWSYDGEGSFASEDRRMSTASSVGTDGEGLSMEHRDSMDSVASTVSACSSASM